MKRPIQIIILFSLILIFQVFTASAQRIWTDDGNGYYSFSEKKGIEIINLLGETANTSFLSAEELTPKDLGKALKVQSFQISSDENLILLFTNTKKVWRENTRGDYWTFNKHTKALNKLGTGLPESSLMFAKFSPDGKKVAYVSKHNIYIEELSNHQITQITKDGGNGIINGTFDWVYEEEFGTKDGFRWSPDGSKIAFWKQDAKTTRNFLMINNTDSLYSFTVPVEYPKVGQDPSATAVWFYDVQTGKSEIARIDGDPKQHYIPRMEWLLDSKGIILQQLNRKQNESKIIIVDAEKTKSKVIYTETDAAWIDIKSRWNNNDPTGWDWTDNGKQFLWLSEKGGFRQIYKIDLQGKESLLMKDNFDVIQIDRIDSKNKTIYFSASPNNATQKYLYSLPFSGGNAKKITPASYTGTNSYNISPNGKIASFQHSSVKINSPDNIISLPDHKELKSSNDVQSRGLGDVIPEFFKVKTIDGIELDGWMVKPKNFDPSKKYPVVFYVYGEPASQTVTDDLYTGWNFLYNGDMTEDGYVYVSLENRGAPAPKGREWRKSIYQKIGQINIRDQAMGAKEVFKMGFIDTTRVAVWGWSGGGASTLNLLGQYPEIYQTGISIAPVTNQLLYDNIYQERYMGLPQENPEPFIKGSATTYAKNIKGNLLLIHGTGDDNVHYQNAEVYINELIKHNILFQMMSYPNRTHSISEGEGTFGHLSHTYTDFLKKNCPPGAR